MRGSGWRGRASPAKRRSSLRGGRLRQLAKRQAWPGIARHGRAGQIYNVEEGHRGNPSAHPSRLTQRNFVSFSGDLWGTLESRIAMSTIRATGGPLVWEVPMGQTTNPSLPTYECRILDRNLRVIRTVRLACTTDAEATATATDLFMRQDHGEDLAGFEIHKDRHRLLVQLRQRPRPPQFLFEEEHPR